MSFADIVEMLEDKLVVNISIRDVLYALAIYIFTFSYFNGQSQVKVIMYISTAYSSEMASDRAMTNTAVK